MCKRFAGLVLLAEEITCVSALLGRNVVEPIVTVRVYAWAPAGVLLLCYTVDP